MWVMLLDRGFRQWCAQQCEPGTTSLYFPSISSILPISLAAQDARTLYFRRCNICSATSAQASIVCQHLPVTSAQASNICQHHLPTSAAHGTRSQ
jgi:hypothetical protein